MTCPDCRSPVVIAITESGRRVRLDTEPRPGGRYSLTVPIRRTSDLPYAELILPSQLDRFPGELFRLHAETCCRKESK